MPRPLRIVVAATFALTGCNALLDVKDIYFDPNAGGPGASDGSTDGPTTSEGSVGPDGGSTEAAAPCNAASLVTDPANCGRCGHDCAGGTCMGSVCQPVIISTGLGAPTGLAVDATTVYVTMYETGAVVGFPKAGGAGTPLASNEIRASGVAVSGTTLFWGNGDFRFDDAGAKGGIWKCTLPGCTAKTLIAASGYGTSYPVIHGAFVYYSTGEGNTVARAPLGGGAGMDIATTNQAFGVAVDDVNAYYTSGQPTLYRAHVDGTSVGNEEVLGPDNGSTAMSRTGFVTVDADRVYWAYTDDMGKGHVLSAAKSAPAAGAIAYGAATDNIFPVGVAVDADNVYWSTAGTSVSMDVPTGDGKIFACPKAGCPAGGPVLLATGGLFGGPVTTDDKAVYWAEYGATMGNSGRVRKVAKP